MNKIIHFTFVCILLAATACSEREAYYKYQEIEDANWAIDNVLSFKIDTTDMEIGISYDIFIEITNNVDYPYQNLWLFLEYNKNDSTKVKKEEEFILADEFGKWKGAGFASLYQSSHMVLKSVFFDEKRAYNVDVRHGMQNEMIHGIERVGIKISKSK